MKPRPCWYVYLIECHDGSLYAGIAVDVAQRYAKHAAGKGARYTRSHPPLRLLGQCAYANRSEASRAEYRIKQLAPTQKRELCASWPLPAPIEIEQARMPSPGSCRPGRRETASA